MAETCSSGNYPLLPFSQAAVKQSAASALQGPDASRPYFTVRFAMPIPPENDEHVTGPLVGIDPGVHDYHQSPGFEVMPNGDVLAIPYSGLAHRESGKYVNLVQARLRYGADEFDMPEEVTVQGVRMQDLRTSDGKRALHGPPLLWREEDTVWLFTGFGWGWGVDHPYRFRVFKSTDSGATWSIVALEPKFSSTDSDPQPITSAFRAADGDLLVACDGKLGAGASQLWRSSDNGLSWHDQGGRTSGRHSTIVPLDDNGTLLSLGGKDTNLDNDGTVFKDSLKNGYMPQNISTDWGRTWGAPTQSPFPWCGANQRPCVIRLAGGNLVMVGDSRHARTPHVPPGWTHGDGPYVALSTDNGRTWTIKALPVALRHVHSAHTTIGYSTVRQAPNGVIHLLTSRTHPMLHYEFNEAWIIDPAASDIVLETTGGTVQSYRETYPGGAPRATWSARITPDGRYLLDGPETHYYENGATQREVTWVGGRRTGAEILRGPDGVRVWSWDHDLASNTSVWTHWWPDGRKRLESHWNTNPAARDLPDRRFRGLVANGTARHWDECG
ncbi:MAG: exo-alpha-sialidase, partial [Gemmatimonadales bacterium]